LRYLLQIVFVELNGLIDQEWSHAAGQVCKIIVSKKNFMIICCSHVQSVCLRL